MIEQLRPLQNQYNTHIVPVARMLCVLFEQKGKSLRAEKVERLLEPYGIYLKDLEYLSPEVIRIDKVDDFLEEYLVVSMPKKEYDFMYDYNLLENAKTVLRDIPKNVKMYDLAKLLVTRYPVEDIPYIIDLLKFNDIIERVYYK